MPTGSLGRSSLSTDACPIPSLCPAGRAALLMRWARGPLPRLARLAAAYQSLPDPLGQGGKCLSAVGMCSGHRRGNSPAWLAGTRFLPDLCCQSSSKLAPLQCDNCRRVLMEAAKAGWEQPRSLGCWRSMLAAACDSPGLRQSQGNQRLGLHHMVALGHLFHPSSFHLLPGAEVCPLSPDRLSLAVGLLL